MNAERRLLRGASQGKGLCLVTGGGGSGKTMLCKTLAAAIGGTFGRIQGTTDLLPSDVTGISVYDAQTKEWEFQLGPIFHTVVLIDKTQRLGRRFFSRREACLHVQERPVLLFPIPCARAPSLWGVFRSGHPCLI